MTASPNLKLPFLDPNQNQKTVTHNAALTVLDALVNLHVASTTLQAPPAAPNDGQCWIVASGATGAWLGKDLNVAAWQDGVWSFYAPNPGFVAYVDALGGALMWNGTAWVSLLGAITQLALADLGIGTAADPSNPLSAMLNAALFAALPTSASPAGSGDIRVKLSKQAAGNAASLLLQDAFSGRAEIGLVGDDNLHLKVSANGTTFSDALVIAAGTGAASFVATPVHPSPAANDSSTASATTAWVAAKGYVTATGAGSAAPVQSVAGRTGAVTLAVGDVAGAAPLASPALTGTPTAPNAAAGTNTAQVATTSFVAASFVPYAYASATYATLANASLTGTPTAPTPSTSDNSTKLATTAYVQAQAYAPLASPGFTGTPTAPNAAAGTNTAQIATTSFVAASFVTFTYAAATYATANNATLTGTPTAPTQAVKDNSTRLATTAYADRAVAALVARTQVTDATYTALATDRTVAVTALTAARTINLPAAGTYPQGATLTVVDESGACSATNTLTIDAAGSDVINGAGVVVLSTAYGYLALESNGSNKWTVVDQSTLGMGQQAPSAVAITGGAMNGTAVGPTTPASGAFTTLSTTGLASIAGNTVATTPGTVNKLALYSNTYGIGVSNGSLDHVSGGSHSFYSSTTLIGSFTLTGLNATAVGASTASTGRFTTLAATTSLALPSYTVATLPAAGTAGRAVYASNARAFNGAGTQEAAGAGTGSLVIDNGTAWKVAGTNVTASA